MTDAPATDGNTTVDDGGASEAGADDGAVSGPEVGPDAAVDSPADAPVVDAPVVEAGDALGLDGVAGNCYQQIKDNGYAAGTATPCSSCMENQFSREAECKAKLDCLAAAGRETCGEGTNCYTDCLNAGGGGSVAATCATALVTAAGCQ